MRANTLSILNLLVGIGLLSKPYAVLMGGDISLMQLIYVIIMSKFIDILNVCDILDILI